MKDSAGQELAVGDTVVFNVSGTLVRGEVVEVTGWGEVHVGYLRETYNPNDWTAMNKQYAQPEWKIGKTKRSGSIMKVS